MFPGLQVTSSCCVPFTALPGKIEVQIPKVAPPLPTRMLHDDFKTS